MMDTQTWRVVRRGGPCVRAMTAGNTGKRAAYPRSLWLVTSACVLMISERVSGVSPIRRRSDCVTDREHGFSAGSWVAADEAAASARHGRNQKPLHPGNRWWWRTDEPDCRLNAGLTEFNAFCDVVQRHRFRRILFVGDSLQLYLCVALTSPMIMCGVLWRRAGGGGTLAVCDPPPLPPYLILVCIPVALKRTNVMVRRSLLLSLSLAQLPNISRAPQENGRPTAARVRGRTASRRLRRASGDIRRRHDERTTRGDGRSCVCMCVESETY